MKAKLGADDLWLSFQIENLITVGNGEPDEFVFQITGEITTSGVDKPIGRFSLFYVDLDAAHENGESAIFVFDAPSQELIEYFEDLYDIDEGDFSPRLQRMFGDDLIDQNILILDRLEILPHFRGQGLGLFVTRTLIQRFAKDAGLVAIKPFPLQFEARRETEQLEELKLSEFSIGEKAAFKKLRAHYAKLGFVEVKRTPYMVLY